jgi:hypothetical protein
MEAKLVLTITNKDEYDLLYTFLKGTTIKVDILSYISEPSVNLPNNINSYSYLPSDEFKNFCGKENLNQFGLISIREAYNFIVDYTKKNNLYKVTHIDTNPILASALKINSYSIPLNDLPNHLMKIFIKV